MLTRPRSRSDTSRTFSATARRTIVCVAITRPSAGAERPRLDGRPCRWPFTCCRPDQLHRIGDIHATVVVAAERGARLPHAAIAVDPNGDLLSGFQAMERDAEALVPENRVG
jgi:hypothetical protein